MTPRKKGKASRSPVEVASRDAAKELRERLKALVPAAFQDGQLDVNLLLRLVGQESSGGEEPDRYRFTWAGQGEAIASARAHTFETLRPEAAESVDWQHTANAVITGDNLEALKLLAPAYTDRIKCIYIDPPYNIGTDRVYKDDFRDPRTAYLKQTGQMNGAGISLVTNPETGGRFHSQWLAMLFPRLWWAQKLLADDGIIFVSIDDHEVHHLRLLMDLVFGQENHVANFVWVKKKKGSHLSKSHRAMTEYVVAYAKDKTQVGELYGEEAYKNKAQPLLNRPNRVNTLTFEEGVLSTTLKDGRYPAARHGNGELAVAFGAFTVEDGWVTTPLTIEGRFRWTQSKLDEELSLGSQPTLSSKFGFNVFRHDEETKFKRPTTLLNVDAGVGTNEDANKEIIELLGEEGLIDYPKPSSLIKYLVRAATYFDPDAVILDFFAGSGTTAEAVWEVNREVGGRRSFILVQLPEQTEKSSRTYKRGYKDLAALCRARVRAGAERQKKTTKGLDLGFRAFTLAGSAILPDVLPEIGEAPDPDATMKLLRERIDPLVSGWDTQDVVWEVAIKAGYPIVSQVEEIGVGRNRIAMLTPPGDWERKPLLICLDDRLGDRLVSYVVDAAGTIDSFVCRDATLTDTQAANLSLHVALKTL